MPSDTLRNSNFDHGLIAESETPGGGVVKLQADPTTHELLVKATGTVTVDTSSLATSAKQDTGNTSLASIDTKTPALGQALAADSVPVVLTAAQLSTLTPPAAITGYATETTLATRLSESDFDTKTGSLTETAPSTDTASSGLNGRLQRIAQRLTSLITTLGSPFQAGGSIGNTSFDATQGTSPWVVSGSVTANPTTPTTVVAFVTAVTTAGTRVQLGSNAVSGAILQAPSTNTGIMYIGGSNVSSTVYGAELQPGQATSIAIDNTNKIYIDSSVNGEKVAVLGS